MPYVHHCLEFFSKIFSESLNKNFQNFVRKVLWEFKGKKHRVAASSLEKDIIPSYDSEHFPADWTTKLRHRD